MESASPRDRDRAQQEPRVEAAGQLQHGVRLVVEQRFERGAEHGRGLGDGVVQRRSAQRAPWPPGRDLHARRRRAARWRPARASGCRRTVCADRAASPAGTARRLLSGPASRPAPTRPAAPRSRGFPGLSHQDRCGRAAGSPSSRRPWSPTSSSQGRCRERRKQAGESAGVSRASSRRSSAVGDGSSGSRGRPVTARGCARPRPGRVPSTRYGPRRHRARENSPTTAPTSAGTAPTSDTSTPGSTAARVMALRRRASHRRSR